MKVCILDYQAGNIFSIKNALQALKIDSIVTDNEKLILKSDGLILPGVGSYPKVMNYIKRKNLDLTIKRFIETERPFLGTCLGMQLLFEKSQEFGSTSGLSVLKGKVLMLPKNKKEKVPNMGWQKNILNSKIYKKNEKLFSNNFFYFVHSYYVECSKDLIYTYSYFDDFKFCSSIKHNNIFATQFHLEKSGKAGLKIIENFFLK
jgi:glutamine amidotransferase